MSVTTLPIRHAVQQPGWLARLFDYKPFLIVACLTPAIGLLTVFLTYPLGLGVWLAFTDTTIGRRGVFVGFENFNYFYLGLCVAVLIAVVVFAEFLRRRPYGRVLRAIREDQDAVRAFGRVVYRLQLSAFFIGSALAGLAGGDQGIPRQRGSAAAADPEGGRDQARVNRLRSLKAA